MTVFGINADVDGGLAAAAQTLGLPWPPVTHFAAKYFNSGMPASVPGTTPYVAGVTHPIICLKPTLPLSTADQAALGKLAVEAEKLGGHASLSLWQEGEHSGYSPAELIAAHELAHQIVHSATSGAVRYGQCVMTYTASTHSSHYPLTKWIAKGMDFYGFDTYPWNSTSAGHTVLDGALAQLEQAVSSPRVAITECNYTSSLSGGITYTAGSDPPTQWFKDCWAWAQAHGAWLFMIYARTSHGVPWPPPDKPEIAELATIAKACGL